MDCHRLWSVGTLLIVAGWIAGCNQGLAVGTVTGDVTLDGQPLKGGRVLFTPIDGQGQTGGATIADGRFKAEVPVAKMPVAKVKVQINANKVVGREPDYAGV